MRYFIVCHRGLAGFLSVIYYFLAIYPCFELHVIIWPSPMSLKDNFVTFLLFNEPLYRKVVVLSILSLNLD